MVNVHCRIFESKVLHRIARYQVQVAVGDLVPRYDEADSGALKRNFLRCRDNNVKSY